MRTRALTFLVGIVATILMGWVLHSAAGILQPLIIALLLASMLQPIVRWLAARHIPPPATVLVLVTLLLLGFAQAGVWVRNQVAQFVGARPPVPAITQGPLGPDDVQIGWIEEELTLAEEGLEVEVPGELSGAAELGADADHAPARGLDLPGADEAALGEASEPRDLEALAREQASAEAVEESQVAAAEEPPQIGWSGIVAFLARRLRDSNLPTAMVEYLVSNLAALEAQGFVINLLGTTFGFSSSLLLVVIYMLFIFAEQAIFRSKILAVAGERADEAAETLDAISRGIQRYLSVKTVVSLATGVLCYSVLEALRIPYAPLLGFLTFALNFIPTFGSIAAGLLATITAFAAKGSYESALIVGGAYLMVNTFLGSFLEPRILGRELNLSPLVVLISVVVWAGLWGIAGTFLAVPLTATLQIVLAHNESTRPIAILLGSGPQRHRHRLGARRLRAAPSEPT